MKKILWVMLTLLNVCAYAQTQSNYPDVSVPGHSPAQDNTIPKIPNSNPNLPEQPGIEKGQSDQDGDTSHDPDPEADIDSGDGGPTAQPL